MWLDKLLTCVCEGGGRLGEIGAGPQTSQARQALPCSTVSAALQVSVANFDDASVNLKQLMFRDDTVQMPL